MTLPEKTAFCESVHRRLVFQSDTDRLREIVAWAETWQSLWLPEKLVPDGNVDFSIGATHTAAGEPRFRVPWPGRVRIVSHIVAAWRAVAGIAFANQRPAVPENENQSSAR